MRIKDQLTGAYKSFQSLSQYAGLGRKGEQLLHCCAYPKGRHLQIEELEERQLLAVTAAEYAEIRTAYSDIGLSETMSDVNIIEVKSNDLSVSSLKTAIETAGTTAGDDLIVLRTTGTSNKITYAAATDKISINIDAAQKGKLTIIGFGAKSLTIDAKQLSRVMSIGSGSDVSLANLTITGGNSDDYGGGIYNDGGMLTVTNTTISGNSANGSSYSRGGGIYNDGELTVTNTTISGNSASRGGGIYNYNYGGTLTVSNSIIALNHAGESCNDIDGTLSEASGHNIIGYNPLFVVAPIFDANGVLTNADTLDLRLNAGSSAIDAGSSDVTLAEFDLDGNPRVVGNGVDIGAYEYQGTAATEPTTFSTVVDTLEDVVNANDGKWSLREALYWATGPGTITFNKSLAGGTIYLNSQLAVNGMSIDGGSLGITLDAQEKDRVMNTSGDVTLNGLTITGGKTDSDSGGIYNVGTLTVTNSTISGNSTSSYGGGIYNVGTLTVTNTTLSGNSAEYGGGIYNDDGELTVTNTTISGNSAYGSYSSRGGGIYNYNGTLTVTNTTISGNSANGSYSSGGGIGNVGTLTVTNTTLSGNSAKYGGGIGNDGIFNAYNTIIACNTANTGNDIYKEDGTITSYHSLSSYTEWGGENNIVYDSTKPLFVDVDSADGDYRLAQNSQAIDRGNNSYVSSISTDLIGTSRIYNGTVDLGAYEYSGVPIPLLRSITLSTTIPNIGATITTALKPISAAATYQWYRGTSASNITTAISGATSSSYTVTTADIGYYLKVVATGTEDYTGTVSASTTFSITRSIVVTTTADTVDSTDGVVSLREAIASTTGGETILFASSLNGQTITLVGGELTIAKSMTIDASTLSNGITINADQKSRVMSIGSRADVSLANLTITGGKTDEYSDSDFYGGGIYNDGGMLTVTNTTISGNSASRGGGIYNYSGTITVTNTTISGNLASRGGGIYNYSGTITVTNTTISGNLADSDGGGIFNDSGELTVTNTTISGISASTYGGGIYNSSGMLTVTNTTISGNSASAGGGIYNSSGMLTVTNTTISGNSASSGGGIYNGYGELTVTNSIIAWNHASESCNNIYGILSEASGHNIIGYNPLFVVAPVFDSYGVLTNAEVLDLRLTAGSRAINTGSSDDMLAEFDLDGNQRIVGSSVDVGAYEFQGTAETEPTTFSTVVNTLEDVVDADDGKWSLREALYWTTGPGTITFNKSLAGGTIYLNSRLSVNGMSIDGGSLGITLDAQEKDRVMNTSGDVTLNGLTITGGKTDFYSDSDSGSGGGIYNEYGGTLSVMNSTISGNSADYDGGGIFNNGELTVTNSTISGNSVSSGGGIYNVGTLTVTNTTISGNSAESSGGGVYSLGTFNAYNTIIACNTANTGNDIYKSGGTVNGHHSLSSYTEWVERIILFMIPQNRYLSIWPMAIIGWRKIHRRLIRGITVTFPVFQRI